MKVKYGHSSLALCVGPHGRLFLSTVSTDFPGAGGQSRVPGWESTGLRVSLSEGGAGIEGFIRQRPLPQKQSSGLSNYLC